MSQFRVFTRKLRLQFLAPREESEDSTYKEIKEGTVFKGYNLWILCFAMVIACIGLTTNSTAAVIGAMLISPLMGPIIGFAFGLAINDESLRKEGIRNWILMTVISLIAATIFFLINPFDHSTEIIEAFKSATIFDIFLAFFGGMAGFIGIVKKEGVKIIAGVAVATACMPPLCTAAYGIAHLDYEYFLGGMYFYCINSLFIGWATFLLSKVLKFSKAKSTKKLQLLMWDFLIIVALIPGCYIAYKKWKVEENTALQLTDKQKIEQLNERIMRLEEQMD
ncbi:MAG: DUF389 domain-containing protein [Bacteroidota bacterium]